MEDNAPRTAVKSETRGVVYVGDPRDNFSGPVRIKNWGYVFEKNKPRNDIPLSVANRAAGHDHFEVEGVEPRRSNQPTRLEGQEKTADEYTLPEIRALLDERKVDYAKNANRGQLIVLINESGGFPSELADEEED